MTPLVVRSLPSPLIWKREPRQCEAQVGERLRIVAGANSDWFISPAGGVARSNAPLALFTPPKESFLLSARVTVDFTSMFDAGVLFVYEHDELWAKLCYEYSPQKQPMVVSVVTRGRSDDCNSATLVDPSVHLRIYRHEQLLTFHYSLDGREWHLVRQFTLRPTSNAKFGFSAQSPSGQGCSVLFSDIDYRPGELDDLRSGQ